MFSTIAQFEWYWKNEYECSKRVIAALPNDKLSFKPNEKSRAAGELAWHFVTAPIWFVAEMLKLPVNIDFEKSYPKPPETTKELLKAYDFIFQTCLASVKKQKDSWLDKKTDFFGKSYSNSVILSWMLLHEEHHRGQFSVYLKLAGAKVPSIHGPSADDENFVLWEPLDGTKKVASRKAVKTRK